MLCFRLPDQYNGAGKHWSFPGDGESAPGSLVGSVRCGRIWSFAARTRSAPITPRKSVAWPPTSSFARSHGSRFSGFGTRSRYVEMTPALKPILFGYVDKVMPATARFVCGCTSGTKMQQRNALRYIGIVMKKSKVRRLSWHCFRHSYATGYLVRGGRIENLRQILGAQQNRNHDALYAHGCDIFHQWKRGVQQPNTATGIKSSFIRL